MLNAFKTLNIPNFELQFPNALSNNTLNEEVVDALHNAGMLSTEIAVESGSPYVQKNIIHKYVQLDKVKYWVDYLHSKKILVKCLFILGFPDETKEQMLESIEFAKTIKADWCIFNVATPLVGTEMYEQFIMKGVITDEIEFLAKTDFRNRIFDTPEISAKDVNELQYIANLDVNFINNPNLIDGKYNKALELYDDVLRKYPWHIIALCCKKRCYEKLENFQKVKETMNEIKKLVKTSNRSQSMLVKYGYLMNELKEMMNISKGDMLKDNKFDEALSIGTKTN
jgi:tetratricopeptide (TPR) repeat protein